ncbi:Proteophosphoglycan ppg4 [Rhodotorula toruloides ATCC 204091]|nr:Proteophosphoglycan ppg4 [Rhodotorula toruloides ATCC 204091]KAK4334074.1 hypothetical protein RTBOTA2_002812 [Rhodotorula toruloides]PRQ72438.1 Proteophosphoglycan ppg4 [Rhodotorula toruloides]
MAVADLNTCIMCGKKSESRCQPCGKAGVEVYFCGAEYQRAIWPVHKFFCGPKACPLVWPDLTAAEADAAWKQRTWYDDSSEAIHYEDHIPITSAFKQIIGIEENELQNVLQSLTGKGEMTPTVAARRQALVKWVRLALFNHTLMQNQQSAKMYGNNMIMLHGILSVFSTAGLLYLPDAPWISEIVARIMGLNFKAGQGWRTAREYKEQLEALKQFRVYLDAKVPRDERREGIVAGMDEWLTTIQGIAEKQLVMVSAQQSIFLQ